MFKKPLEDTDQVGGALLDPTEVKLIFGNVGPIYEIHSSLLLHLKKAAVAWREDASIGALFLNYVIASTSYFFALKETYLKTLHHSFHYCNPFFMFASQNYLFSVPFHIVFTCKTFHCF